MTEEKTAKCLRLFSIAVILAAFAGGLSANIFSNYFKDVFNVTALQRGFLETPRESGGVLCAVIFMAIGFLGDASLGVLSQILMAAGLVVMGFFGPSYAVMILFLMVYSTGQHLFMPVNDSIGMSLAEADKGGTALGRLKKYNDIAAMAAGIAVFAGFKAGFFSFNTPVILSFAIAMVLNIAAAGILCMLKKEVARKEVKAQRIAVKKDYIPYYLTTFAYGCQKRIRLVFAPWVLIELLNEGADTVALALIIFRLAGGVVAPYIGRYIDANGIRKSLKAEAALIALIFCFDGAVAWMIAAGGRSGLIWVIAAVAAYVLSYLTEQFNMVHSVMLKKLAGDRKEDISANLSMGVTIDHIMAIVVSPVLGYIWVSVGPQWVFFVTAITVLIQVYVSAHMLKGVTK